MSAAEARICAVLAALDRLRAPPVAPLSDGLSEAGAAAGLASALDAITAEGLAEALGDAPELPASMALIAAGGVFVSPIEWAALAAAGGVALQIKAPSASPALCEALVAALAAEGLPATLLSGREIPEDTPVILAFGSDETLLALARAHPRQRLVGYGHAFSAALWAPVDRDPEARRAAMRDLAVDMSLFDSRGCMAPTALFTTDDPLRVEEALLDALAETERAWPRGALAPALGPLLRERAGLARIRGRAAERGAYGALTLPVEYFRPVAAPRVAVIHPVPDLEAVGRALEGWPGRRSTLGTNLGVGDLPAFTQPFSRVCPLGTMQSPPFPRQHDGRPMLGAIAAADDGPALRARLEPA